MLNVSETKDSSLLFYKRPAATWNEALPLGNGRLGAMIFGGTVREHLALNLDELWTGTPRANDGCGSYARDAVLKAAEAAKNGDSIAATSLIRDNLGRCNVEAYMPFGHLYIDFKEGKIGDYARSLSLNSATHYTVYDRDGGEVTSVAFASFPDKVIVYHLESEKPLSFTVSMDSEMMYTLTTEKNTLYLDGICIANSEFNRKMIPGRECVYGENPAETGISYRGGVRVVTSGICTENGGKLSVCDATETTLYFTAESNFNGYDKLPYTDGKEYKAPVAEILGAVTKKGYEKILRDHVKDYCGYYNRVALDLDFGCEMTEVPTDERLLKNAETGSDRGLIGLLYNYGRYLTISASRPGSQPMNLQGIWNESITPPWHSNYTTNINTEMNYYPTLMSDLPEMHMPLVKMMKDLSVTGEYAAKTIYGARGFVVHHNTDLWRSAYPSTRDPRWFYWPMASGWLCRHLFDHYLYTADKVFLRDTALPIMEKSALFYLDMLSEDKDGYLVMAPSTSPENTFLENGVECSVAYTSTMTMTIIKELFGNCLRAAKILDMSDGTIEEIKVAYPRLLPFRIGKRGDIVEWYKDEEWVEPQHRHISHLYGLHPAHEITPEKTPELAEAAKKTMEIRGDAGTGWSLGWKINFCARLRDGNHALKLIKMQLKPVSGNVVSYEFSGGTYPNMFDAHPPFQIDGNFGATSGITEMLVQTDGENTYILPALPSDWKNGSFNGVRIIGGAKLYIAWKDGILTSCRVEGTPFGKLIYNGKEMPVLKGGTVL